MGLILDTSQWGEGWILKATVIMSSPIWVGNVDVQGTIHRLKNLDLPQARFSSSQLQQKESSPYCLLPRLLWAFPARPSPLSWDKKNFDIDCFADFGAMVEIRTPEGGMGGGNMETLIKIKNSEQQETEGSCL